MGLGRLSHFNLGDDPFPRGNARYGIEGARQCHTAAAAGLGAGG